MVLSLVHCCPGADACGFNIHVPFEHYDFVISSHIPQPYHYSKLNLVYPAFIEEMAFVTLIRFFFFILLFADCQPKQTMALVNSIGKTKGDSIIIPRYHVSNLEQSTNQSFEVPVTVCLTNRFHVAVRLFSNRSQMTSKCGKNKKVAHELIAECVTDVLTTFSRPL